MNVSYDIYFTFSTGREGSFSSFVAFKCRIVAYNSTNLFGTPQYLEENFSDGMKLKMLTKFPRFVSR